MAKTHGMSKTKIYYVWRGMRSRCENPNHTGFKYYGGRGIKVCSEWSSFEAFFDWAMNSGYREGLTLDRTDVDGNYSPENCAWRSMKCQVRNRRNSACTEDLAEQIRRLSDDGVRSIDISRRLSVPVSLVSQIRYRRRWAADGESPVRAPSRPLLTLNGESKSAMAWSRDPRVSVSAGCIKYRKRKGMSDEYAILKPPTKGRPR